MKTKYILLGLLSAASFYSCDVDFDEIPEKEKSKGSLDLTKYVAIGNSLTAGFRDGGVFPAGQNFAYPKLMAAKFAEVGGGEFKTPFIPQGKSLVVNDEGLLDKAHFVLSVSGRAPVTVGTPTPYTLDKLTGDFNNLGVPGAKSYHLLAPGYGSQAALAQGLANPYYVRFSKSETSTVIADAVAQKPTFFSLWIGNNDVLGYATGGGAGKNHNNPANTDPSTYAGGDISHVAVVVNSIAGMLQTMTKDGAKGVVMNIPPITAIPFFTTVPYNAIPLKTDQVTPLNAGFKQYNDAMDAMVQFGILEKEEADRRKISFKEGQNAVVIVDETLTDVAAVVTATEPLIQAGLQATGLSEAVAKATVAAFKGLKSLRQATAKDLLVLTSRSILGQPISSKDEDKNNLNGLSVPLGDRWVLTEDEIKQVNEAVTQINTQIKALVDGQYKDKLAFVDMNAVMQTINKDGVVIGGLTFNSAFATGGVFSLDGVHITGLANGYVANLIIDALNAKFAAKIPKYTDAEILAMPQQFLAK